MVLFGETFNTEYKYTTEIYKAKDLKSGITLRMNKSGEKQLF